MDRSFSIKYNSNLYCISLYLLSLIFLIFQIVVVERFHPFTPSLLVEERTCLVCKEDCIEHEQHFLMNCRGYTTLRHELYSHISNVNTHYNCLSDNEKPRYLLRAEIVFSAPSKYLVFSLSLINIILHFIS